MPDRSGSQLYGQGADSVDLALDCVLAWSPSSASEEMMPVRLHGRRRWSVTRSWLIHIQPSCQQLLLPMLPQLAACFSVAGMQGWDLGWCPAGRVSNKDAHQRPLNLPVVAQECVIANQNELAVSRCARNLYVFHPIL